jgi:myo-inositol-1(or 4)-monophosphatase
MCGPVEACTFAYKKLEVYSMQPSLKNMITWAYGAGEILRAGYGKQHSISLKGRIDIVTEMDHRAETYLVKQIQTAFPDHTIYAEESGHLAGKDGACWYIDPLDGTTNYAHAIPYFSVSVAYAEEGIFLHGVVYDPMRNECFSAARGKGAWLNGEPIRVSDNNEMVRSLLVTGFPYDSPQATKNNLEAFDYFTRLSQGVRRMGSAALDLSYVAAGRFEGYWEQTLSPWDMAAGALIVREAGGRVTNIHGDENLLTPPFSIAAGNPVIHEQLLQGLKNSC